jgi:hypothetical protein
MPVSLATQITSWSALMPLYAMWTFVSCAKVGRGRQTSDKIMVTTAILSLPVISVPFVSFIALANHLARTLNERDVIWLPMVRMETIYHRCRGGANRRRPSQLLLMTDEMMRVPMFVHWTA